MDEILNTPEKGLEPGESRSAEGQSLDDATTDPRAYVERTGDFQQAEAIQNTLTSIVDNASKSAGDIGATPLPIPRPEDESLTGSQPKVRGDLDQVTTSTDDGRLDATPIPLPGQQGPVEATPIPLPAERIQPEAEEEGHPPEPPDLDHNPYPEETIAEPETDSLTGGMPDLRGDLDQVKPAEQEERHEATPIPLPGQEGVASSQPDIRDDLNQATTGDSESDRNEVTPINLPGPQATAGMSHETPAMDGSSKDEALPLDGDVRVERRFTWEADKGEEKSAGTPERPLREAANEKPILNQELEDLDTGLDKLGDLEGMLPGPGKLENAPGEKSQEQDLLSGMPGLEGFKGGPSDLRNDAGMGSGMGAGKGHEIPGWESPFPPGKGPGTGAVAEGGGTPKKPTTPPAPPKSPPSNQPPQGSQPGKQDPNAPKGQNTNTPSSTQKFPAFVVTVQRGSVDAGSVTLVYNSASGQFDTLEDVLNRTAEYITFQANEINDPFYNPTKDVKTTPDEGGSGKDPSIPLNQQMEGDRMNPKFDAGQISNYPEDHIQGSQGGGKISEQNAESIKRMTEATAEKNAKVASTKPKDKAEQITDPPEPQPGKKSETSGKGS